MVRTRNAAWLTVLVVAALGALALSPLPFAADLEARIVGLLAPAAGALSRASQPATDVLLHAGQISALTAENATLRDRVAQLESEAATLREGRDAEEQARVLPALGARWLDTRPFSGSGHSDGIHFTRTAYADFARRIAAWMEAPETGISLPSTGAGGGGWAWPVAGAAAVLLIGWVVRRMRG